jgi:hypothetical protein
VLTKQVERLQVALISQDLDGGEPWWDPQEPIGAERAQQAAARFKVSEEEIRANYEKIAEKIPITLAWRA